jgi:hypothetical protein
MPARIVFPLLLVLTVPALTQQTNIQNQISQHIEQKENRTSQVIAPAGQDPNAAHLLQVRNDVTALSTLSASVQSELRQLQQGVLVKDLNQNLKKMEKLSKKLRREME